MCWIDGLPLSYIRCVSRLNIVVWFFFSSRRRHTRLVSDWSSDVCSSDLIASTGELCVSENSAESSKRAGWVRLMPYLTLKIDRKSVV